MSFESIIKLFRSVSEGLQKSSKVKVYNQSIRIDDVPQGTTVNASNNVVVNFGEILNIATGMLEEEVHRVQQRQLKDITPHNLIENKKLSFLEACEDICGVAYKNKINISEFSKIMKKIYCEHLLDKLGSYHEISSYLSSHSSNIHTSLKNAEKTLIPQKLLEG